MSEQIVRPMGHREAEQLLSSSYASYGGIYVHQLNSLRTVECTTE
ncbi:MAG: hypothetical protein QXJ97_08480 [Desulfurococcaceae archaeon]